MKGGFKGMKLKDIGLVKILNKELRKVTERYSLIIDDEDYIMLWDSSYENGEMVFKSNELTFIKGYVEGFILARETKG